MCIFCSTFAEEINTEHTMFHLHQTIASWRSIILLVLCSCAITACTSWQDAKNTIATADRWDTEDHILYNDTLALGQAIDRLDNPIGRLLLSDALGRAHYYMGRNLSMNDQILEATTHYVAADRRKISNPIYRGRVNSCMAHICKQNENDSLALIFFERANSAFHESGNEWYYAQTLLDVSEFEVNMHHYAAADSLLQIAQSYQLDSAYIARYYETKGMYYYAQQQYDSALVYFLQSADYWYGDADKLYTYMKIMQVYLDMDRLADALPYAQFIVDRSYYPNYLVNAYYCLILHAKQQNDAEQMSIYTHERSDAQKEIRETVSSYAESVHVLKEHLANPRPLCWIWMTLLCIVSFVLILTWAIVLYRRRTIRLLQVAHQQIDDLSAHIVEKDAEFTEEKRVYDFNTSLSNIRAKYPKPRRQWNDYNELQKDLDAQLHDWFCRLNQLGLSNRENVYCVFTLLYPYASLEELASYIHYSETGISTFKRRIAQKIGVQTRDLYDFLHDKL